MLHIIAQMAGVGMFEEDWAVPVNCPAPPQGGGKPHKRERKRFTSECPTPPQQAPQARTEARFTSECPALPQGGGKPHKRERKRFRSGPPPHHHRAGASRRSVSRAMAQHHHRAGASPAPTIHGLRRPFRRIVGATLAVALRWGPCCNLPYVRAYGGKPCPYYIRAWWPP